MRKLLIGFVVVLVGSLAAYLRFHRPKPPLEAAYASNREVTIWSTVAQVRAPVATVSFGDRLDVMNRFGDQVQVRTASGVTGWANDHDLLSADLWQRAKDLGARTATLPVEARGHTHVLSNLHLDPGRDAPRVRQLNKNVSLDLFERRVLDAPSAAPKPADDDEGATAGVPGAQREDWWLVRSHLPDRALASGWILGRFIDLDVPEPLPDYASSAGMRIVAWFELNQAPDSTGAMKSQYLVLGNHGFAGRACDFTLMRVFTWGKRHQRYETAFVESNVCGKLPVKLTQPVAPGGDVAFSFQDFSSGAPEERLYRMRQTIVRRVKGSGPPFAPRKQRL